MNQPSVRYDADADVLYVQLNSKKVARTGASGDLRLIDYDKNDNVVGVEFISANEGVDLRGLPFATTIEQAITDSDLGMKVFA